jgi:hypothetical protein
VNKNLKKHYQNKEERKEILNFVKENSISDKGNVMNYVNSLTNQGFKKYFHKTWKRFDVVSMLHFSPAMTTNNHIEREFRSLKLAIKTANPINELISELYLYSKAKSINEACDKVWFI